MNTLKTIAVISGLLFAATVDAQVYVPAANLTFSGTGYTASLTLGGSTVNNIAVGPFKIATAGIDVVQNGKVPTEAAELAAISQTSLWFCMDPLQPWKVAGVGSDLIYQSTNSYYFDQNVSTNSTPKFTNVTKNGISAGELKDLQTLFSSYFVTAKTTLLGGDGLVAAALQLAIWEVVNENNGGTTSYSIASDVTGGNFYASNISSALRTQTNTMLDALNSYNRSNNPVARPGNIAGGLDFLIDGSQTYNSGNTTKTTLTQDYVGWDEPVPEASTYGFAAVGLIGMMVVGRMRRKGAKLSENA